MPCYRQAAAVHLHTNLPIMNVLFRYHGLLGAHLDMFSDT